MKFIISRTDAIGDVILTFPLLGALKEIYPTSKIYFLAKNYTKSVVETCSFVDFFVEYEELLNIDIKHAAEKIANYSFDAILHILPNKRIAKIAKIAKIPLRIGTRNRFYHWTTCNKLLKLSRKNSELHEAQLNLEFAKYFGFNSNLLPTELYKFYGFSNKEQLLPEFSNLLSKEKLNVIIHPKSNSSAREWGFDNFNKLINILYKTNKFKIFVTGIEKERNIIYNNIDFLNNNVVNLVGKLSLAQLISFIEKSDALIAASTGPLHIAAMAGINSIGLFPPIRPMHPGRWAPIGKKAKYFVKETKCNKCRNNIVCKCLQEIEPAVVANYLLNTYK